MNVPQILGPIARWVFAGTVAIPVSLMSHAWEKAIDDNKAEIVKPLDALSRKNDAVFPIPLSRFDNGESTYGDNVFMASEAKSYTQAVLGERPSLRQIALFRKDLNDALKYESNLNIRATKTSFNLVLDEMLTK